MRGFVDLKVNQLEDRPNMPPPNLMTNHKSKNQRANSKNIQSQGLEWAQMAGAAARIIFTFILGISN